MTIEELLSKAGERETLLTGGERERMRALLADYAAFKPVRGAIGASSRFHIVMRPVFASVLAFSLFLVAGGGAAYAAEGTLPGDLLYPIKVDVNEPVITALTSAGQAQVAWHITIAKRRLKEAAALSAEGRLATSTEAALIAQAADATLKGAIDAAALAPETSIAVSATTSTPSASSTATLIRASKLLLEGRSKLKEHDGQGAANAFRASIRAASQIEALSQTAGTLELGEDEGTTTNSQDDTSGTTSATSTDQGASVLESVLRTRHSEGSEVLRLSTHASTTIQLSNQE